MLNMKRTFIPVFGFVAIATMVFVSCKTVDHKSGQQASLNESINILSTQGDQSPKRCYPFIKEGKAGKMVFYCGTCSYVPGEALEMESYGLNYCREHGKK